MSTWKSLRKRSSEEVDVYREDCSRSWIFTVRDRGWSWGYRIADYEVRNESDPMIVGQMMLRIRDYYDRAKEKKEREDMAAMMTTPMWVGTTTQAATSATCNLSYSDGSMYVDTAAYPGHINTYRGQPLSVEIGGDKPAKVTKYGKDWKSQLHKEIKEWLRDVEV